MKQKRLKFWNFENGLTKKIQKEGVEEQTSECRFWQRSKA